MAQFVLTVRCTFCSRHFSPQSLTRYSNQVRVCPGCRERHDQAVEALAGKRSPECQCCHKSVEVLAAEQGTDQVGLWAHFADGVYALFCKACSDRYEQKRRDLYGHTAYGQQKGISA